MTQIQTTEIKSFSQEKYLYLSSSSTSNWHFIIHQSAVALRAPLIKSAIIPVNTNTTDLCQGPIWRLAIGGSFSYRVLSRVFPKTQTLFPGNWILYTFGSTRRYSTNIASINGVCIAMTRFSYKIAKNVRDFVSFFFVSVLDRVVVLYFTFWGECKSC